MAGDTRSHLNRSAQHRFRRIFLVVSLITALVLAPLVVRGDWRLEVAHRLDLVPGQDVQRIAGAGTETTLIVVPIHATSASGRDEIRFRAAFLAEESGESLSLTSIDTTKSIALPLGSFDFVSASFDGRHVLFRDTSETPGSEGVLVNVDSLGVTIMPATAPFPEGIAGDWEIESWQVTPGSCDGISPNAQFIFCFRDPTLATYLAGDWQIDVLAYGDSDQVQSVFRGNGLRPWAGWSMDGSRLYFENEEGIWMATISADSFGNDTNRNPSYLHRLVNLNPLVARIA